MKTSRTIAAIALAAGLLGIVGCGSGERYVAVSGIITVDGKPYDDGVIVFQPQGSAGNINPGMGSSSYTNAEGRFVLKCQDGVHNGAVVGTHLVQIRTKGNVPNYDPATGSPDGDLKNIGKADVNIIPPEWNSQSTKTFTVTSSGTDKANFDIISIKKTDKKK